MLNRAVVQMKEILKKLSVNKPSLIEQLAVIRRISNSELGIK